MPAIDYVNFLPRQPVTHFNKIKYGLLALIVTNVVYQILISLFAMDFLIATTQKQLDRPETEANIRSLLLIFLVVSLLFDVMGIVGAVFESFHLVFAYAVIVAVGMVFAVASVFNGQAIVLVDVVIYLAVASLSFYFAKLLKARKYDQHVESLP